MQPLKISDYARSPDGHANCALVGGMLILTGIAVGMALAHESSKAIQGSPESYPNANDDSGNLTHLLMGEVLKLLK